MPGWMERFVFGGREEGGRGVDDWHLLAGSVKNILGISLLVSRIVKTRPVF